MRPLDFYRLGISLAEIADDEAAQRTAVNRLYYGLHHEACCRYFRVNAQSTPLNARNRHAELRERFNVPNDPKSQAVRIPLQQMMVLRRMADYEIAATLRFKGRTLAPQQLLVLALQTARQLLNALEAYSPGEAEDGCTCLVQF